MPKLLSLLILVNLPFFCFAQQKTDQSTWHLTIVDSATNKGIDKATLSINKKLYYDSDRNGIITTDKASIHKTDNITVSCVGYKSLNIPAPINKYADTIRLSSATLTLKEVVIKPSEQIELTVKDVKKRVHNTHRLTSPGCSYVQYIPNKSNMKGIITSVQYNINDILQGIEQPFRIRLFTKMKDSVALDKELTTDSIVVYNPQRKKLINVDVSKYNIQMPENGVLVVFEVMPRSYYSKDSVIDKYNGSKMVKTPGIDMIQTKNYWGVDKDNINRETPYSIVGFIADKGKLEDWYVYADGNNFAISITVSKD